MRGQGSVAPYDDGQYMDLVGVKVLNNHVSGTLTYGLQSYYAHGAEFRGNRSEASTPMSFVGATRDLTITDNTFVGSGTENAANICPTSTTDLVFERNIVDISAAHSKGLGATTQQTNLRVRDNVFRYNGTVSGATLVYFIDLAGLSILSGNVFVVQTPRSRLTEGWRRSTRTTLERPSRSRGIDCLRYRWSSRAGWMWGLLKMSSL